VDEHGVIIPEIQVAVGGESVASLVRKQVCLDQADIQELDRIVLAKGGRPKGYSFSSELTRALRDYLQRHRAQQEETTMTPVWQRLLDEKFEHLETWLRPGVWGGATYSTTAALLLLEVMCGKTLDPRDAKTHFELIRGRAWKIVRRDPTSPLQAGGAPTEDA
jgi:hypothetical protein